MKCDVTQQTMRAIFEAGLTGGRAVYMCRCFGCQVKLNNIERTKLVTKLLMAYDFWHTGTHSETSRPAAHSFADRGPSSLVCWFRFTCATRDRFISLRTHRCSILTFSASCDKHLGLRRPLLCFPKRTQQLLEGCYHVLFAIMAEPAHLPVCYAI